MRRATGSRKFWGQVLVEHPEGPDNLLLDVARVRDGTSRARSACEVHRRPAGLGFDET
jgi:hypothetical protein